MKCKFCKGSGVDRYLNDLCRVCNGTGEIPDPEPEDKPCKFCGQSGVDKYCCTPCRLCNGLTYLTNENTKLIHGNNKDYVSSVRIKQLKEINSSNFDLSKFYSNQNLNY